MSCDAGRRRGLDPALLWLWLWHRPAAIAPITSLAWEPPHAASAALEKGRKLKKFLIKKNSSNIKEIHLYYLSCNFFYVFFFADVMTLHMVGFLMQTLLIFMRSRLLVFSLYCFCVCAILGKAFLHSMIEKRKIYNECFFFFFLWPYPRHAEFPGPRIKPTPQQWQHWIINRPPENSSPISSNTVVLIFKFF